LKWLPASVRILVISVHSGSRNVRFLVISVHSGRRDLSSVRAGIGMVVGELRAQGPRLPAADGRWEPAASWPSARERDLGRARAAAARRRARVLAERVVCRIRPGTKLTHPYEPPGRVERRSFLVKAGKRRPFLAMGEALRARAYTPYILISRAGCASPIARKGRRFPAFTRKERRSARPGGSYGCVSLVPGHTGPISTKNSTGVGHRPRWSATDLQMRRKLVHGPISTWG